MSAASCLNFPSWIRKDRPRAVVHLNIADFAVAVERMVDSRINAHPVIIAPERAARAVVYDMSEEAYRAGVRKNMPLQRALRCCRDAAVLPPHPDRYERVMKDIFQQVLSYSPLIEPGDVDGHLFIDVTGTSRLFGPPVDVAWHMYKRIRNRFGLAPVWSVAPNKLISKVATRLVKPLGEYIVGHGEESAFLAPLPVRLLPGIERDDLIRLRELNLSQVCQVAALTEDQLAIPFGKRAGMIFNFVRGIDPAPVLPAGKQSRTVMADHEFGNDTNDVATVERALYRLVEKIGSTLRGQGRAAAGLTVMLDHSDGLRRFRRMSVRPPSGNDITLFETARSVLYLAWTRRVRLRHIRLICAKPVFPPSQMELFVSDAARIEKKRASLICAVDHIRERFGRDSIVMGRALGKS